MIKTYRWSRIGLTEREEADFIDVLNAFNEESLASHHQSSQRNFFLCKAHGVAFPSILAHKSIPYVEGLDLPTHLALGQICASKPMRQ